MALWMMAGSIKIFGANEYAIRLPSVLLSILSVFLTFLIASELFSNEIKRLKNSIGNTPTVLYGNPFPIETMFYTDYISYTGLPTEDGAKNAHRKGYQIAVLDNGRLPKEVLTNSQVLKIKSPLATFNPN
jgi:hypothetical protein